MAAISRNDSCPCGSGQKYKRCCLQKKESQARDLRLPLMILAVAMVLAIGVFAVKGFELAGVTAGGGLIAAILVAVLRDPPAPREGNTNPDSINFGN